MGIELAIAVIGSFNDEQVRKVLLLDRQYKPLYHTTGAWTYPSGDKALTERREMKT